MFNYIVGNPPYLGNKLVYHKITVKMIESLANNGELVFITPSAPYLNKTGKYKILLKLREYLKTNQTDVEFIWGDVFWDKNLDKCPLEISMLVHDILSITHLKRLTQPREPKDIKVKYVTGLEEYVPFDEIAPNQIPHNTYISLLNKYKDLCNKYGSILDLKSNKPDEIAKMQYPITYRKFAIAPKVYFSIFSNPDKTRDKDFIIKNKREALDVGNESNKDKMYEYLASEFAEFGLSFMKSNSHCDGNMLQYVPNLMHYPDIYNNPPFTPNEKKYIKWVVNEFRQIPRSYLADSKK
jgi:hypothetical protein